MKKQLIIAAVTLAASFGAFGQGYVLFTTTSAQGLWYAPNATAPGSASTKGDAGISVGFMWASSGTPLVDNASGGTSTSVASAVDWSGILNESTFHFATNSTSGNLVVQNVTGSGVTKGGVNYNGGNTFGLQGSVAGSTIQVFAVAWSSAYANPWLAAANNSFLGWSKLISYSTAADSGSAALSFAASGMPAFGVQAVPEPATFAIAGLGIAAMLIRRRQK